MKELKAILRASPDDTHEPVLLSGNFNFSLRGGWSGTVVVERSFDGGVSWGATASHIVNIEDVGYDPEGALYRARFATYTSGTAEIRFGQ